MVVLPYLCTPELVGKDNKSTTFFSGLVFIFGGAEVTLMRWDLLRRVFFSEFCGKMRSTHPEIPRGDLDTNALDLAVAVVAVTGSERMEPWQYLGLLVRDGGLWCVFFLQDRSCKAWDEIEKLEVLMGWICARTCVFVSQTHFSFGGELS